MGQRLSSLILNPIPKDGGAYVTVTGAVKKMDSLERFVLLDDGTMIPVDAIFTALVQTTDFFPPIVDDPYLFGQIAAAKAGLVEPPVLERLYAQMAALNKAARDVMVKYPVHSCTDVTGFALLGHSYEMAQGSGGLLMALPREAEEECLAELREAVPQAAVIGSVTERQEYAVYLD